MKKKNTHEDVLHFASSCPLYQIDLVVENSNFNLCLKFLIIAILFHLKQI